MYKLLRGGHNRWEDGSLVKYKTGDVFEVSEAELKFLGDRLELVSGDVVELSSDVEDSGDESNGDSDFSFLSAMSWQDAVQAVNALDTLEDLEQAKEFESASKRRGSVLAAIDRRMQALSSLE